MNKSTTLWLIAIVTFTALVAIFYHKIISHNMHSHMETPFEYKNSQYVINNTKEHNDTEMLFKYEHLSSEAKSKIEEYTQYVVENAKEYSDCGGLVYYLMMRGAQERLKDVDLTEWINTYKSKLMLGDNPSKELQIQAVVMDLIWPQVIAKLYNYSKITYKKAIYISDEISNNIYYHLYYSIHAYPDAFLQLKQSDVDDALNKKVRQFFQDSSSNVSIKLIDARMTQIKGKLDEAVKITIQDPCTKQFTSKYVTGLSDSFYDIFMSKKSEDLDDDNKQGRERFMETVEDMQSLYYR